MSDCFISFSGTNGLNIKNFMKGIFPKINKCYIPGKLNFQIYFILGPNLIFIQCYYLKKRNNLRKILFRNLFLWIWSLFANFFCKIFQNWSMAKLISEFF